MGLYTHFGSSERTYTCNEDRSADDAGSLPALTANARAPLLSGSERDLTRSVPAQLVAEDLVHTASGMHTGCMYNTMQNGVHISNVPPRRTPHGATKSTFHDMTSLDNTSRKLDHAPLAAMSIVVHRSFLEICRTEQDMAAIIYFRPDGKVTRSNGASRASSSSEMISLTGVPCQCL